MSSEEEDKYFKERDREKIAEARRAQQLAAIRQQEREGIQEVLQSSDEVATEALALGFDSETARVLPLVPLIQMAWADGKVTSAENDKLLEMARRFRVNIGTPAHSFLTLLLGEQPSGIFFERVNRVIEHLVEEHPEYWEEKSVVELAREVAEASGGFFNLTDPISASERDLLADFAAHFEVGERRAADLLNGEES